MSIKRKKFPKKAKLMAEAGFSKIIKIKGFERQIVIPLMRKLTLSSVVTNAMDLTVNFEVTFFFTGIEKGYAIYRQVDVIKIS